MKKIILSLLVYFMVQNFSYSQPPEILKWKIENTVATKMIERLYQCGLFRGCHASNIIDGSTNAAFAAIKTEYSKPGYKISLVNARYRNDDEGRYRDRRGTEIGNNYKVGGHTTILIMVQQTTMKNGMFTEPMYFDSFTICPPPYNSPCSPSDPPVLQ